MTAARDDVEISALLTDRYLDALLTAADRGAPDAPADIDLDLGVRAAAAALRRDLLRVSPSFRFEERLSARLGEVAIALRTSGGQTAPEGPSSEPIPLPRLHFDPLGPDPESAPFDRARPFLIRGAVASAVVSIAGAAWFAWRRSHAVAGSGVADRRWPFHRAPSPTEPIVAPAGPIAGGLA